MGTRAELEIDSWLRDGGLILASSDRAARALQRAYHHRRRTEGLRAWLAPEIHSWSSFIRARWDERAANTQILLNSTQEEGLWADIIGREQHLSTILEGPRHRLAALAIQAHDLLCSYVPRYLNPTARSGWDRDAEAFSKWLSAFSQKCNHDSLLSPSRAPLNLITVLREDSATRAPLLIVGFDRLLPVQGEFLAAWGPWQELAAGARADQVHFYAASSDAAELAACAAWCKNHLAAHPDARLLVISQQIASQRGEIERAFLQSAPPGASPCFEFSLGIPLSQVPLAHAAYLILRWLDGALLEHELDWLLSTTLTCNDQVESAALLSYMRSLRRRNLARTEWTLEAFAAQSAIFEGALGSWYRRMNAARQRLTKLRDRRLTPFDWAGIVPQLLDSAGLPGERRLASAEFQAWRRWEQALDTCGALGFDGRRMTWSEFLTTISRVLDETLYTPESSDAPIQIAGAAESAGLTADAIWFLGADEDSWPTTGSTHPFLPLHVQREADMPHATARSDWELAQAITVRLMESAPVLHFSYAIQKAGTETRPSRLIKQLAGPPHPVPTELTPHSFPSPVTVSFNDTARVALTSETVQGGSSILTSQSQCPFKAFAIARLGAQGWDPAEFGLTAAQRGQLLHAVLHSIWAGPPVGLRSLADLLAVPDLQVFVESHVQRILKEQLPPAAIERLPQRYLHLEGARLTRVVSHWLEYEATRLPFTVAETEVDRPITIGGLTLKLRLDRIDRLNDASPLVIDYKTGDAARKAWELPRPDDVQLPLYASFALADPPGGLLFAKVRPGEARFVGHARAASSTLFLGLKRSNPLERQRLTDDQLRVWREYIEQLADDFVAGRADVDPSNYPATCERCDLHSLCRVHENRALLNSEADDEESGYE
jgi:ATP-dependent helicase/nuclease subunit B